MPTPMQRMPLFSSDDALDGIDANCDGGDGDHNDAVHVSVGYRVGRAPCLTQWIPFSPPSSWL